jgi:hypothetical protein
MEILQKRAILTNKSTISRLYIDGVFQCFILENPVRLLQDLNNDGDFDDKEEGKIWGNTAIPSGKYKLELRKAGKFHTQYTARYKNRKNWHQGVIHLLNVKGFKFILFHIGNTSKDTHGCLLPGLTRGNNSVLSSAAAYEKIYPIIRDLILSGKEIFWNIEDHYNHPSIKR